MGTVTFLTPPAARVDLVSETLDAEQTLGKICRTFDGELSIASIPTDRVAHYLRQLQNTALQGPLEMIQYVWLFRDVTRSFQQQITRYRIGTSFNIESLRFVEKREARVLDTSGDPRYRAVVEETLKAYWDMLDSGEPAEDARGMLPLNICSDMFVAVSLRTLVNMYEQRMCCQSQRGEWQPALLQMKRQLPVAIGSLLKMSCEGENYRCLFHSGWDRPCPKRRNV